MLHHIACDSLLDEGEGRAVTDKKVIVTLRSTEGATMGGTGSGEGEGRAEG